MLSVVLLEDLEPRLDHQWVETWQRSQTGEVSTQVTIRSQDSERQYPP